MPPSLKSFVKPVFSDVIQSWADLSCSVRNSEGKAWLSIPLFLFGNISHFLIKTKLPCGCIFKCIPTIFNKSIENIGFDRLKYSMWFEHTFTSFLAVSNNFSSKFEIYPIKALSRVLLHWRQKSKVCLCVW